MSKLREVYGEKIDQILALYPAGKQKSAVLPLLHLSQVVYGGWATDEAKADVAGILGVDPTHVHSIAGFYTLYYEKPVGKYVLEICNDLACALRGADEFLEMATKKLNTPNHGTSADNLFTIENVMCIGACDRAPVLQCNLKFHEHLDEAKFDALITTLRAQAKKDEQSPTISEQILADIH